MFAEKQKLVADLEVYGAGGAAPAAEADAAAAPPPAEAAPAPPAEEPAAEWRNSINFNAENMILFIFTFILLDFTCKAHNLCLINDLYLI